MVPFRQALAGIVRQLAARGGASLHETKCNLQTIRGLNIAAATLDQSAVTGCDTRRTGRPSLSSPRPLDRGWAHACMPVDGSVAIRRGFATGEGPPDEKPEVRSLQQILEDIDLQSRPSGKRMSSSEREDDEGPGVGSSRQATVAASDNGESSDSSSSSSSSDSDDEHLSKEEFSDDELSSAELASGAELSANEASGGELSGDNEPSEDDLSPEVSEVQRMWHSKFEEWAQQAEAASFPPPRLVSEYMFREDGTRIDEDSPLKVEEFWPTPESLPKLDVPNIPLEVHGSLPPGELSIETLMTKMDLDEEGGLPSVYEMYAISEWEKAEAKRQAREKELKKQAEQAAARVRNVDEFNRSHAVGKRKSSVARVWLKPGEGLVTINGRQHVDYFGELDHRLAVLQPLFQTGTLGQFNVRCLVKGGGLSGQSQAIRHGISKALQLWEPELRPALRSAGLLTRDPRVVERKKPGKAKARKSFQWVKR